MIQLAKNQYIQLYHSKRLLVFIVIALFYVIITFLSSEIILTEEVYYNSYANQMGLREIEDLISKQDGLKPFSYLFQAVFLFVKFLIITVILYTGLFLSNLKAKFADVFQTVQIAEFIMILVALIKVFYFLWIFDGTFVFKTYQGYYPLSIISFTEINELDNWLIYPLQSFNLFEPIYWFLLAIGLGLSVKQPLNKAFLVVFFYYVPAFAIWILFITMLGIYMNP